MLQRIQTIYLLIIVILSMTLLFLPLGVLQAPEAFYRFDISGISTFGAEGELLYPTWGLYALTVITAFVALVTIFLFKRRILQIRLSIFNGLLMVGFYGLVGYIIWNMKGETDLQFMPKIALGFPLINIILDYLAIRNIGADEALVRSLERLR
ncbi:MAG: DUF4293 domain-containing protein [Tannerellaceae bacterium]|nr:DUF4293 domain-containing protein [Tannerellaceae bacterium]MCD7914085.1 DUF4293 domain-containing protein [Tannerellaceae bacterium]